MRATQEKARGSQAKANPQSIARFERPGGAVLGAATPDSVTEEMLLKSGWTDLVDFV